MQKSIILAMLLLVGIASCRKEQSANQNPEDVPQVEFQLDEEIVEINYDNEEVNECSMYQFGGNAGNYFGLSAIFKTGSDATLEITLGTMLSENTQLTDNEFMTLISPGDRAFGSLGSFSSYPQLAAGKAELALTDKHGKKWCSTRIHERKTQHGIETTVEVVQPGGKFRINEVERVQLSENVIAFRLKGDFNCFLYEVNGKSKKRMKGEFVGVVKPM